MMDFLLEAWVSGIIEGKKIQWMMGKREPWQPGEKLKLLFAGYNGTRNTGSDVRVEEMPLTGILRRDISGSIAGYFPPVPG
jgi:hypothetical protein